MLADEKITFAADQVTAMLAKDSRLPDLYSLLNTTCNSRDYSFPSPAGDLLVKKHTVLPQLLLDQFLGQSEGGEVLMGLAQGKAWCVYGARVFVWNMNNDLSVYEQPDNQPIIQVQFCPVKKGVFIDSISECMVVVCPSKVSLVAIASQLQLHQTDIQVSTEDVNMLAVASTSQGRVFLGGADGCLYELCYELVNNGRRTCKLANRSSSFLAQALLPTIFLNSKQSLPVVQLAVCNNLLFVLNEADVITLYSLETNKKLISVDNVKDQVDKCCPSLQNWSITSIHPTSTTPYISLIAVMSNGGRIYFSSLPAEHRMYDPIQLSTLPVASPLLQVVHVRMLISPQQHHELNDPKRLVHRPVPPNVHTALAFDGLFVASAPSEAAEQDEVILASLDPTALVSRQCPLERCGSIRVDGRVWDILASWSKYDLKNPLTRPLDPIDFQVLTNAGIYECSVARPVDYLLDALQRGADHPMDQNLAVKSFFDAFGPEQAVALCTVLCSKRTLGVNVPLQTLCVTAMVLFGASGLTSVKPLTVTKPFLGSLASVETPTSPLLSGMYLGFARLVENFWNTPVSEIPFDSMECVIALQHLRDLFTSQQLTNALKPNPKDLEGYYSLSICCKLTMELLAFASICQDYAIHADKLFKDLYYQPEVVKQTADKLVMGQLSVQASSEHICDLLRAQCPSYFGQSEMLLYAGMESLERALRCFETKNSSVHERNTLLASAIDHLTRAASAIVSVEQLRHFLAHFQKMEAWEGCVDVAVAYAAAADPDNQAVHLYQSVNVSEDVSVHKREEAYGLLLECFGSVSRNDQFKVLRHVARTPDELLQIRFFDYLVDSGLSGALLEGMASDSPYLEPYLVCQFNALRSLQHMELLYKYYGRSGRLQESAKVLMKMAEAGDELDALCVGLQDRIEYLTRAITMLAANSQSNGQLVQDCQDLLQVGSVQLDIYNQVDEHTKKQLAHLLTISDLFNRFTRPLHLHACSLALLSIATGTNNEAVVQIWKEAVDDALARDGFDSIQEDLAKLLAKYPESCLLPVADYLLQLAHSNTLPAKWTVDLFSGQRRLLAGSIEALRGVSTFWGNPEHLQYLKSILALL